MKRPSAFASAMFRVSRAIGRKDFPDAVRTLEEHIARNPTDTAARRLLAQCHRWSGSDEQAIEVAESVLCADPHDFGSLRLLSEVLATRGEHQRAANYARRGLEEYPKEMAPVAPILFNIAKAALRIFRAGRPLPKEQFEPWKQINEENRQWFQWAQQYLAWFDRSTGNTTLPVVH
jgi:tetratricopeptide (TPR) repeat protein